MKAIDTNVCLRLLVDDSPAMTELVANILDKEGFFVSTSVLLETYWVVRSRMDFSRERAFGFIRDLLSHPAIEVQDGNAAADALDAEAAGLEFDDALHLFSTPAGLGFISFDRQLVKRAKRAELHVPTSTP